MKISETIMFDSGFRMIAHQDGVTMEAGEITVDEARELGYFLYSKFGAAQWSKNGPLIPDSIDGTRFCLPIAPMPIEPDEKYDKYPYAKDIVAMNPAELQKSYDDDQKKIEELRNRRASYTHEIKVGNPDLAYSAPDRSSDGRQRIAGMEVTDLAALSRSAGILHSS